MQYYICYLPCFLYCLVDNIGLDVIGIKKLKNFYIFFVVSGVAPFRPCIKGHWNDGGGGGGSYSENVMQDKASMMEEVV